MNYACSGATVKKLTQQADDQYSTGGLLEPYIGAESVTDINALARLEKTTISGATTTAVLKPQIQAIKDNLCPNSSFPCGNYPDFLIFSIGVNDFRFSSLVREYASGIWGCGIERRFMAFLKLGHWENYCASYQLEHLETLLDRNLAELANEIRSLKPRQVILVSYPDITKNEKGQDCNDSSLNSERTLGPRTIGELGFRVMGTLPIAFFGAGVSAKNSAKAYTKALSPLTSVLSKRAHHEGWLFLEGASTFSQYKGWCAEPSWFIRWADSRQKQGMMPMLSAAINPRVFGGWRFSLANTMGTAHPNFYGHNFLGWQVRCVFEKADILKKGTTDSEQKGVGTCRWLPKPPSLTSN
jgi:hypothetical protein